MEPKDCNTNNAVEKGKSSPIQFQCGKCEGLNLKMEWFFEAIHPQEDDCLLIDLENVGEDYFRGNIPFYGFCLTLKFKCYNCGAEKTFKFRTPKQE